MNYKKLVLAAGFVLTWFSLTAQFVIMMQSREIGITDSIIRFFTYFTILSNGLAALSFSSSLFNFSPFFSSFKVQTAIAVYISIVAIVYNSVLRFIWEPTGLQRLIDELLHVVNPVIFILYWYIIQIKISLTYRFIFRILIFPSVYLVSVLVIGRFSNHYPYPFLDVNQIGCLNVFVNSLGVTAVFVLVSLLFIFINNRRV